MNKYRLSQRLNQMAKWLDQDVSIADIGTDHGYLPYCLFEQKKISHAILCDINQGPLENAKNTFKSSDYVKSAEFRLGSGIEPIEDGEVDYVIIAGMGGTLIKKILSKDIKKTKSFKGFFLQPQTEQDVLRHWLLENQFQIISDFYAFEDQKYYEALYVLPQNVNLNPIGVLSVIPSGQSAFKVYEISNDLEFGYKVHPDSLETYRAYLEYKAHKYKMILSKLSGRNNPKAMSCQFKLQQIEQLLRHLKKV
ncbi:tRNA (adenine(22)-N(1))-methyltransferase [Fusibacter ferrireducens]|uniref:SAM-dependent methyltransferase n=1 Tax=Fusibacter ferrireducens TaxID=2785058 RepID=A0ABR9ZNL6_9FIRM|nr:class I SAM-dependent methyltransferase [Fusibacter ferrireducens]MBF4692057.1 SAM-dependent methyltransferase [Fusibacter ferrireducens]